MSCEDDTIDSPFPPNPAAWAERGFTWTASRWHLHDKPLHAGQPVRLQARLDEHDPPGPDWIDGRIETADCGRTMFFHLDVAGRDLRLELHAFDVVELRR
jgi:hypothetical protein